LRSLAPCVHSQPTQTDKGVYYADHCRTLANAAIAKHQRILIVLDGIDEALGERFAARWFPRNPGTSLRLLLSARWLAGDAEAGKAEDAELAELAQHMITALKETGAVGATGVSLEEVDAINIRRDVVNRCCWLSRQPRRKRRQQFVNSRIRAGRAGAAKRRGRTAMIAAR
jgi:hypothetical protein